MTCPIHQWDKRVLFVSSYTRIRPRILPLFFLHSKVNWKCSIVLLMGVLYVFELVFRIEFRNWVNLQWSSDKSFWRLQKTTTQKSVFVSLLLFWPNTILFMCFLQQVFQSFFSSAWVLPFWRKLQSQYLRICKTRLLCLELGIVKAHYRQLRFVKLIDTAFSCLIPFFVVALGFLLIEMHVFVAAHVVCFVCL